MRPVGDDCCTGDKSVVNQSGIAKAHRRGATRRHHLRIFAKSSLPIEAFVPYSGDGRPPTLASQRLLPSHPTHRGGGLFQNA